MNYFHFLGLYASPFEIASACRLSTEIPDSNDHILTERARKIISCLFVLKLGWNNDTSTNFQLQKNLDNKVQNDQFNNLQIRERRYEIFPVFANTGTISWWFSRICKYGKGANLYLQIPPVFTKKAKLVVFELEKVSFLQLQKCCVNNVWPLSVNGPYL